MRPQTFTCNRTAIRRPGLPFNGRLHPKIHVIAWITTHLLTPGWKAELNNSNNNKTTIYKAQ